MAAVATPAILKLARQVGVKIYIDDQDGRLTVEGTPDETLKALITQHATQLRTDLTEDKRIHDFLKCPQCEAVDYLPLGGGACRCFGCGNEWARK